MAKNESELTWKDIEVGAIATEPGSARRYKTGDWRSQRPTYNHARCLKCGLCQVYCPEGCIHENAEGKFETVSVLLQGLRHLRQGVSDKGNHHGRGGVMANETRVGTEVSLAVGEIVRMVNTDVIAAYPITPQTHIVEHLAELVADGKLDADFITIESEHSALSACLGSAAVGARTFTATAGQGLELMHEVLFVASSMRLPIVMAVANRALSSPLSVWGDHSDVMAARDTGWIQIFTENGQEVVDNTLCAFRIAEDPRVLLPVMVNLDGFHLSHMIEPMLLPAQKDVDDFLPPNQYPFPLDPNKPLAMGDFAPPYYLHRGQVVPADQHRGSNIGHPGDLGRFRRSFRPQVSPGGKLSHRGRKDPAPDYGQLQRDGHDRSR